VAKN
jgi:hypothetical protein